MARVKGAWAVVAASAIGVLMTACGGSSGTGSGSGAGTGTKTPVTPTVTVAVTPTSIVEGAAFSVTVTVAGPSGDPTPTGSITLSSGTFSYPAGNLSNGTVTVNVPANTWTVTAGTYTLTATYTPDSGSSSTYSSATGTSGNITVTATPTTYTLTIDSTNPASGVQVGVTPSGETTSVQETTPASVSLAAGTYVLTAPPTAGGNAFSSWSGCTSTSGETCTVTLSANATVTANYTATTPGTAVLSVDSVNPASGVTIAAVVQGTTTNVGAKTPFSITGTTGTVYTLTAPSTASGNNFGSWSGCTSMSGVTCTVTLSADMTVTANYAVTPTVTVTPQSNTVDSQDSLQVTVAVAAPSSDPTGPVPTGSVVLSYGTSWSSAATTLASGSATITVPAETLPSGSDTLTATYTPDTTSAGIYSSATGTSGTVTVGAATAINVNESSAGPATTPNILGVNLESWYDVVEYDTSVISGLQTAGMQALRWPGGSWSDQYHWNDGGTPYMCTCSSTTSCTANDTSGWGGNADEAFGSFETNIVKAGNGFDLALTADYGTNEACDGGGDPAEAAGWAAAAVTDGHPASHITIGNEEYGSWETDLHASPHDPTTYADAVIGSSGYYDSIKTAITNAGGNPANTLVGVVVDADGSSSGWDHTVLGDAAGSYDFVEYHYYPQYQGEDASDSSLLSTYVQNFTTNINTLKNELSIAGEATTPIYVGEISSNSGNGGTQNWSITQALYAGQILGEAMNDGVSRLTWWDGYGNCEGVGSAADGDLLPPNNSSLYGWQDWGAQDIFSAGSADTSAGCTNDGAAGTLSPTAMAFQLFSNVAVNGENVLTATVSGADPTDVKAYAATHSGGTALVLFNLNATTAEPVEITLNDPSQTTTTDMQVITYDKEIYDYTNVNCQADSVSTFTPFPCTYNSTHDYSTVDWAPPTTTDLGSTALPYTLTLQPWSMNVVIIK
ncbi:MAG TPA: hypothetical protein VME18_03510 [Acidobacteriaceae bacterium]|nr:hypothetical protein [Acidobacteriaceae bacterium]